MALEVSGTIFQILPEQTGNNKSNGNPWVRRDFVVEFMDGQYSRKASFSTMGERATQLASLQLGQSVKVSFNIESREYNGRWYTDLRAWRIDLNAAGSGQVPPMGDYTQSQPASFNAPSSPSDDLPF